jgi:splicing factor 3B subunit 1
MQGLFHPARKVRQTYWKVYNNVYIGAQDALVAFMPRFPDTEDANTYVRHELDIVL